MRDEEKERPEVIPETTAEISISPGREEMEAKPEEAYIRPEDVSATQARAALDGRLSAQLPTHPVGPTRSCQRAASRALGY